MTKSVVLFIVGPTASGKSALAVALFVAVGLHLMLPIVNRKHFARLWLLDAAAHQSLSAALAIPSKAKV